MRRSTQRHAARRQLRKARRDAKRRLYRALYDARKAIRLAFMYGGPRRSPTGRIPLQSVPWKRYKIPTTLEPVPWERYMAQMHHAEQMLKDMDFSSIEKRILAQQGEIDDTL